MMIYHKKNIGFHTYNDKKGLEVLFLLDTQIGWYKDTTYPLGSVHTPSILKIFLFVLDFNHRWNNYRF